MLKNPFWHSLQLRPITFGLQRQLPDGFTFRVNELIYGTMLKTILTRKLLTNGYTFIGLLGTRWIARARFTVTIRQCQWIAEMTWENSIVEVNDTKKNGFFSTVVKPRDQRIRTTSLDANNK